MSMIKCPECGQTISDEAPVCPKCGCKIAGNIVKCPECGDIYLKDHPTCPQCGAPQPKETFEPTEKDKKQTKTIWIIVLAILVIIAAGYFFWQNTSHKSAEEQAYEQCENSTDTTVLGDFLRRYPDSVHYMDVKSRYDKLVGEMQDWNNLQLSSSPSDFKDFFTKYPSSPYAKLAKDKYDSLSWAQAVAANTPAAFQAYLTNVPDGLHSDEAQQKLTNIQNLQVNADDQENIAGLFNDFFSALSSQNEGSITTYITPVMTSFLNHPQATKNNVVAYMRKIHENGDQISFTTNNDFKVTKVNQGDGEYGYKVAFTVDESVSGTITSYKVTSSVTDDMHISVLNMTQIK